MVEELSHACFVADEHVDVEFLVVVYVSVFRDGVFVGSRFFVVDGDCVVGVVEGDGGCKICHVASIVTTFVRLNPSQDNQTNTTNDKLFRRVVIYCIPEVFFLCCTQLIHIKRYTEVIVIPSRRLQVVPIEVFEESRHNANVEPGLVKHE